MRLCSLNYAVTQLYAGYQHESRMSRMERWPFQDPENVVTFTVRQIVDNRQPILYVCHDVDDGGWQFLTGDDISMDDALLVLLKNIVAIDPSICELADLPIGWSARRKSTNHPWIRQPVT